MNKLTTLAQMKAALAEDSATLIKNDTYRNNSWEIRRFNGQRIRCSRLAEKLTFGPHQAVRFSHRTATGLTYVPV